MVQVARLNQCWVKNKLDTMKASEVIVTFKSGRSIIYTNFKSILLSKDVVESIKLTGDKYCFYEKINGFIGIRKKAE